MTSTDRESEYAGGIIDHDIIGSVGGRASSLGRGSEYDVTEMRLLLPNNATKPEL
jgi:hypothetical protein